MVDSTPQAPLFGRDAILSALNEQVLGICARLTQDLEQMEQMNRHPDEAPAVFLIYTLNTPEKEPLSEAYLQKFDVTLPALQKADGFAALKDIAQEGELDIFLDHYINFSNKNATKFVRIVIEGVN